MPFRVRKGMSVFEPIGVIESCYPDKFGTPRQPGLVATATAKLKISREWQPEQALQGLMGFSHVWIIFEFHKNTNSRYHAKVHPPRLGGDSIGVFATRSPHRPNPIGLSLVKLDKIQGDTLYFSGIDLIEGTPVFDIKPYLAAVESKPEATGGWSTEASTQLLQIRWNQGLLEVLSAWSKSINQPDLKSLIEETLKLDPRPNLYKGEGEEKYRSTHAVRFYNGDVHFTFPEPGWIEIQQVLIEK